MNTSRMSTFLGWSKSYVRLTSSYWIISGNIFSATAVLLKVSSTCFWLNISIPVTAISFAAFVSNDMILQGRFSIMICSPRLSCEYGTRSTRSGRCQCQSIRIILYYTNLEVIRQLTPLPDVNSASKSESAMLDCLTAVELSLPKWLYKAEEREVLSHSVFCYIPFPLSFHQKISRGDLVTTQNQRPPCTEEIAFATLFICSVPELKGITAGIHDNSLRYNSAFPRGCSISVV